MDEELNDLINYLRLSSYRDGEYFLQDEYEELESIIKRNKTARFLENIRYHYLMGVITEEQYNSICQNEVDILKLKKKIKD